MKIENNKIVVIEEEVEFINAINKDITVWQDVKIDDDVPLKCYHINNFNKNDTVFMNLFYKQGGAGTITIQNKNISKCYNRYDRFYYYL